MVTNYFLGANGAGGFCSLFQPFVAAKGNRDVMVLKGGPGAGKSSFMKYIGAKAEERGEDVEYIWCSGDPGSLDGVRLPRLGIVAVDGTAPHVIEPAYPAAVDRYVNLGCCYDVDALKGVSREIREQTDACAAAYQRAFRALKARGEVLQAEEELLLRGCDRERLLRRTRGIVRRELGQCGGDGPRWERRFLGSLTCEGEVCCFATAEKLAQRIYLLSGGGALRREMLSALAAAAAERGCSGILCPSPDDPTQPAHLILPGLGLAFLTEEGVPYRGKPYRRIHLDGFLSKANWKENKAKCRFYRRTAALLRQEGEEALREARERHDRLESLYRPHVDFVRVTAMAEEEWRRIEEQL